MADAKLIIRPPHMQVRMKPGFWPDLPKMQEAIKKAGFQPIPDRTELVVTGKVVKQGERLLLEVDGLKTPATLLIVPANDEPDKAAHLERRVGQLVEVEGLWQAPAAGPNAGSLAVTAVLNTNGGKEKPGQPGG